MSQHSSVPIVVVGASAGGTQALLDLTAGLPRDFAAAVCVVTHMPAYAKSTLPALIGRRSPLRAVHPEDGEAIRAGCIYVAPPDCHLLVDEARVLIKKGPKENRFRPSIDALFRSAAYTHRERVIGVVLSGVLDDGTSGLWTIKRLGGTAIVQLPAEAEYDSMPLSALQQVEVDFSLPVRDMPACLVELVRERQDRPPTPAAEHLPELDRQRLALEVAVAAEGNGLRAGLMKLGEVSAFACPECGGVLVKLREDRITRFRCHTGHAYTASALLASITEHVDETLWRGMRALEESTMLLRDLGQEFREQGDAPNARIFEHKAREEEKRSRLLHDTVLRHHVLSEELLTSAAPHSEGAAQD